MEAFFSARGYPHDLLARARLRAEERRRADLLVTTPGSNCTAADRPPLVITYHPKNIAVYGMTIAPRSHLTNRRLKPSVALKT